MKNCFFVTYLPEFAANPNKKNVLLTFNTTNVLASQISGRGRGGDLYLPGNLLNI